MSNQTTAADTTTSPGLRRILIVDDEAILVLSMQRELQKLPGCEVLIAASGEKALQRFKQQPFDLLITDYRMPGINGITLAEHIRRLYPKTAIFMVTACGNDGEVRKQAAGLSIHTVLDKPAPLAKLRRLVLEILGDTDRL